MKPDGESEASLAAEVIGWVAFVLFVGAIWKVRQTLDRQPARR